MFFIIGWLVLSFALAYAATQKGRSGIGFFFLSALLSPLVAFVVLVIVPSLNRTPPSASAPSMAHLAAQMQANQSSGGRTFRNLALIGLPIVGLLAFFGYLGSESSKPPATPYLPQFPKEAAVSAPATPLPSSAPNRPLAGGEILEAQKLLYELGFDPGPRDGVPGPSTIGAVKRYEKSRGWAEKGDLDVRLLEYLRAQGSKTPAAAPPSTVTTTRPTTDTSSEEMRLATKAIRAADHPCPMLLAAQRVSDGSVRASCSNGEVYRIMQLRGEWLAMKCSAAERMGVSGC